MKCYWDSSALVQALHDDRVRCRLADDNHLTRVHALGELFSTLTGGRLGIRYSPAEAGKLVGSISESLEMVELTRAEVVRALKTTQELGVRGGHVHDLLHVTAARKAGAEIVFTLNISHFANLVDAQRVQAP